MQIPHDSNPNRRLTFPSLLVVLILSSMPASLLCAQVAMPAPKMSQQTKIIYESLLKTNPYDYSDLSLGDVLKDLKKSFPVEVEFHKSTKDNQFGAETKVNVAAKKMSLLTLLNSIAGEHSCEITIQENKILFVSERRANAMPLLEWTFNVSRIVGGDLQGFELEEAIRLTIDCETWEDTGGNGMILYSEGQMTVMQSFGTMLKVSGALQQLHAIAQGK